MASWCATRYSAKRSRWNGKIHICAFFRSPQEQVLLGNLSARVTSASDHCSAGRYGFPLLQLQAFLQYRPIWCLLRLVALWIYQNPCYIAFNVGIWYHIFNTVVTFNTVLTIECAQVFRAPHKKCQCIYLNLRKKWKNVLPTVFFVGLTMTWTPRLSADRLQLLTSCLALLHSSDSWKPIVCHTQRMTHSRLLPRGLD